MAAAAVNTKTPEKHGLTKTPEYEVWRQMRIRCNKPWHPKYADYGGRGIGVCPEWDASFLSFYTDMGPRPTKGHTLERDDNERGYAPSNCRWATRGEQSLNKRITRRVEETGEAAHTLAKRNGIPRGTFASRLHRGLNEHDAASLPTMRSRGSLKHFSEVPGFSTLAEACRAKGMEYRAVLGRIYNGWDLERALSVPIRSYRPRK